MSRGRRRAVAAARFVAVAAAGLALGSGCVREAAKEVTQGTLEALQRPRAPDGQAGAPAEGAPAEGAPTEGAQVPAQQKLIGGIVRDAVRAGSAALTGEAERLEPFVERTSEAAASGLVSGALRRDQDLVRLVEQGSGAAGRAFTREATDEVAQGLASRAGQGTAEAIAEGAALVAQRTAAAAVRGAMEQLAAELTACPSGDERCAYGLIERASFAAGRGATAGVQQQIAPWPLVLAFAIGLLIAAPAGWALGALVSRRGASPGS
jgi:hypothetical protein